MKDRERGAGNRVAADRVNAIDRHEKSKPGKRETFATSMARAVFRHHYWNDALEDEKRRSLEKARARGRSRTSRGQGNVRQEEERTGRLIAAARSASTKAVRAAKLPERHPIANAK